MMKQYITWTPLMTVYGVYTHPDNLINELWTKRGNVIRFTSLGYGFTDNDARMLGIIEYDDNLPTYLLDRFFTNVSPYCFVTKTPEEVIGLLNEWYPNVDDPSSPYFELDTDGFSIIDNRPKEDVMIN